MYIPSENRVSDQATLFDFIEQNSFALLISQHHGEPTATHLPLLLDRTSGLSGTLVGHMARANPQWQMTDPGVLTVFRGPHVYVSPTWYEATNVVPTWNYVAVHAYGTFQIVESHAATVQIVRDYVAFYERRMPTPWSIEDGDPFVDKLARSVVAFRIEISRLEGKWKLSQNQPRQRQAKVVDALSQKRDENSQAIAAMMARNLAQLSPQAPAPEPN